MGTLKYGDIYLANLEHKGKIKGPIPVILVANNTILELSPVFTGAPIINNTMNNLPTYVYLQGDYKLPKPSIAAVEDIVVVQKEHLIKKIGVCSEKDLQKIDKALDIKRGIVENPLIQYDGLDNAGAFLCPQSYEVLSSICNEKSFLTEEELKKLETDKSLIIEFSGIENTKNNKGNDIRISKYLIYKKWENDEPNLFESVNVLLTN